MKLSSKEVDLIVMKAKKEHLLADQARICVANQIKWSAPTRDQGKH
ncbi:hypothetical protein [Bacillus sp. FJAT-42315]|nr:hypothetical protein [Bacillus sp. FJAT-42315]